jgi:hypothetical protein
MWLLAWAGTVLIVGLLGGILGALSARAARPGVTPLTTFVAAFFAGARRGRLGGSNRRISSPN